MKQLICIQCLWCLTLIVVDCARVGQTESEKQSAFEQLLSGKTGRLRMLSATTTTGLPPLSLPTTPVKVLTDEEAKRHDRRHAVLPPNKHNRKKNHSKRQHHGHHAGGSVGYVSSYLSIFLLMALILIMSADGKSIAEVERFLFLLSRANTHH